MVSFSPKHLFQDDAKQKEAWAMMANQPVLHRAIAYSLAAMVSSGLSPEALAGVNGFIYTLTNLSEPIEPASQMPIKALKSWDSPATTGLK